MNIAKAVLREKFTEKQAFLKKKTKKTREISNNLSHQLKELEKEEQTNLKSVGGSK